MGRLKYSNVEKKRCSDFGVVMINADRLLEIKIHKNVLSISVGIKTLAYIVEFNPRLERYDEESGDTNSPKVTDHDAFAKEVLSALKDEEEDGTTIVHEMLDKAVNMAIENGAEGIEIPE